MRRREVEEEEEEGSRGEVRTRDEEERTKERGSCWPN